MTDGAYKKFMEILKEILNNPPYLIFVFLTSVFMLVSMTTQHYYDQSLSLFLYSVVGVVWRHAVKDIRGRYKEAHTEGEEPGKYIKFNLKLTISYQIVNIVIVIGLVLTMLKVFTKIF